MTSSGRRALDAMLGPRHAHGQIVCQGNCEVSRRKNMEHKTPAEEEPEVYYGDCPQCGDSLLDEPDMCDNCGWSQEEDDESE